MAQEDVHPHGTNAALESEQPAAREDQANEYEEPGQWAYEGDGRDGFGPGPYDDGEYWQPLLGHRPLACRLEAKAQWLLWWGKGNSVSPLVTTGATTSRSQAGVLGQPGTQVLFGGDYLSDLAQSGARFDLTYWLDHEHTFALEGQYFGLGQYSESFRADNTGTPVIARPFVNATTGLNDSSIIAFPNVQTGNVSVDARSNLQGAGALIRACWFRSCEARLDFLAGYRYVRLGDDLRIDEFSTFVDPRGTVPINSTLTLSDQFNTLNEFHGADFGVASDWRYGRVNFGLLCKVGIGNTSSKVSIAGSTIATQPVPTTVTSQGGLLAQTSNIGHYQRNHFTMLPEIGVNLGFDLTRRLRLIGGYSLIYWGAVARTGDQIDLNLAPPAFPPSQTSTNRLPEFRFGMNDYWVQGMNLGLDFRF